MTVTKRPLSPSTPHTDLECQPQEGPNPNVSPQGDFASSSEFPVLTLALGLWTVKSQAGKFLSSKRRGTKHLEMGLPSDYRSLRFLCRLLLCSALRLPGVSRRPALPPDSWLGLVLARAEWGQADVHK